MFVGGVTGFVLDNTIAGVHQYCVCLQAQNSPLYTFTSGTMEERGIFQWQQTRDLGGRLVNDPFLRKEIRQTYDLPFGMSCLRKYR